MVGGPVEHRVLEGGGAEQKIEGLDEAAALISAVREVPMVAGGDAETGGGDVEREERYLEGGHPEERDVNASPNDRHERRHHQKRGGDPVDPLQYAHSREPRVGDGSAGNM